MLWASRLLIEGRGQYFVEFDFKYYKKTLRGISILSEKKLRGISILNRKTLRGISMLSKKTFRGIIHIERKIPSWNFLCSF